MTNRVRLEPLATVLVRTCTQYSLVLNTMRSVEARIPPVDARDRRPPGVTYVAGFFVTDVPGRSAGRILRRLFLGETVRFVEA